MESRYFSEYEDVAILVNFVRFGGNYDAIFECLERKKSASSIQRRFEEFIRFYPYRVGNWTPYEDYMINLWGNMEPYVDPWDKLAFTFCRRADDVKKRYRKISMGHGRLSHLPPSLHSINLYQRGKRVVDVSYYILHHGITPRMRTIKEFINVLKLFDDNMMEQYHLANGIA